MTQAQSPDHPKKEAATEEAGKLQNAVREQAGDVMTTAREHGSDVVQTAKSETQQVVERTRGAVESEARQRTDELARTVRRFGEGLDAMAQGRPEEAGPVAGYVRDAASRVGDVAQRLETRGYDGLVQDVSGFARRRPGIFLASAGVLGFAVGRVLRSGGASAGGARGQMTPGQMMPGEMMPGQMTPGITPGQMTPGTPPAMADATVAMQPVMPSGAPSSLDLTAEEADIRPGLR